jgi:hypothetical protein
MIATLTLDVEPRVSRVTHELMQAARVTKLIWLPLQPREENALGRLNSNSVRYTALLTSNTHGCACLHWGNAELCAATVTACFISAPAPRCQNTPGAPSTTNRSNTVLPYMLAGHRSSVCTQLHMPAARSWKLDAGTSIVSIAFMVPSKTPSDEQCIPAISAACSSWIVIWKSGVQLAPVLHQWLKWFCMLRQALPRSIVQ